MGTDVLTSQLSVVHRSFKVGSNAPLDNEVAQQQILLKKEKRV